MKNFSGAVRDGIAIAVTTASAATSLGSDDALVASAVDISIDNRGDADAYVKFGAANVSAAAATGFRIPAGAIVILSKGNASHMAAIGAAATSLVVHLGEGL